MTRILITGGAGFIGTNLVEFLLKNTDWEINILDNFISGNREDLENLEGFSKRGKLIEGDIRNEKDIEKAIEDCDYVVNLAAQVGVISSVEDPLHDAEINVNGLIKLLNSSLKHKIKKFVHASSAAPLGEQEMPLHEEKIPKPLSPYGASKLAGESYCSAFSVSHNLNTIVLRFSNVYGPKSYDKGSVIPIFLRKMLNSQPVTIYGNGEQTRDFIYVEDICQAIYLSLTKELPEKFNLFQIGTEKETSVNELFDILKEELEKNNFSVQNPKYEKERPGEIYRNYSDISKARKLLGFEPKTSLEEGIKKVLSSF